MKIIRAEKEDVEQISAIGRSRQAVDSYIADLRATTLLTLDLKIFHYAKGKDSWRCQPVCVDGEIAYDPGSNLN